MWHVDAGVTRPYCDGQTRRSFLKVGMAGMGTLSLPQLLRAKELSATPAQPKKDTSVILLWLDGGPSHLDLYDLKPDAPAEYRGLWSPIHTNVPGFDIGELFPLQATIADKFSIVRSLHHDNGDHYAGGHWMLTGRGGSSGADIPGKFPYVGSMATKITGLRKSGMPPLVGIPYAMSIGVRPGYFGGHFLGAHYNPFETEGDPAAANFAVHNVNIPASLSLDRLEHRRELMQNFDHLRRDVDTRGMVDSMDRFERQAYELVTGPNARKAFDINLEDAKLRDRYGRNHWGQCTLLARRLVEAGSTWVSCHFGGWDHHWSLKSGMENYLPQVDQAVYGLLTDLDERGLLDTTLVVLCGEFSRTPRMNDGGNGGPPLSMGTPGRDHWGHSMFCFLAGGGVRGGQIVGSTNRLGEVPQDRPLRVGDIHHTIFHVLGVDPQTNFIDHSGRPIPAIDHGAVIDELV